MNTILKSFLNWRLLGLALVVSLVISPLSVNAATYNQSFQLQSVEERIAYLYGMIAQLQVMLAAQDNNYSCSYGCDDRGRVLGVVYSGSAGGGDIDVTTFTARDIEDDEADLRGEVDLNNNRSATVWFEYGESRNNLDDRTVKRRITGSQNKEIDFTINVDDLDEDGRYYYRAVAEDAGGDRDYGSILSFVTDDDSYVDNNRYGDSDLDVDTFSARDVRDDEADLRGKVDLNNRRTATVWFEYGESRYDLDDRTSKRVIRGDRNEKIDFTINVDDLDEDERYYYRAVAEDEDDDREYGSILSFTTDDDNYYRSYSSSDFELTVRDTTVDRGDAIRVYWEASGSDYDEDDLHWIGLFKVGDDNDEYINWNYIDHDDSGVEEFRVYDDGDFEFRIFLTKTFDDLATSEVVEVD
ncbi:MAG: hypothetical protein LR008_00010 [Candidatus Pacebacteria bacterium]|nr:hypothetical protein [Candidatus Paceibacterota bacterium]